MAKKLKALINDCEIYSIPKVISTESFSGESVGILCPIYMYNMPVIVRRFIKKLKKADYTFMMYTGAGDLGNGDKAAVKAFKQSGLKLDALFNIPLPSNYINFGVVPVEKQKDLLSKADKHLANAAEIIKNRKKHFGNTNTSFFEANIHPGLFYGLGYIMIQKMAMTFSVTDKCNSCGLCARVCPVSNITIESGKPVWHNKCEFCYACLSWCPQAAIESGRKTIGRTRYHHPEVNVKDIIKLK